jgi:uncharacterized protein (TIGR02996 family)
MTDRQAFLNAVIDRPDDDLLRLVFADFLEERGEADRAEFIRLQIEHEPAEPDSPGWTVRRLRIEELLREHAWKIPGLKGKQEFRRGFVEAVGTTAERLRELPAERFDSAPVRDLRVWNASNHLETVARLPWMPRLEHLDLRNSDLGLGERMQLFFSRADLSRLRSLDMRNNILWADDLQTFFRTWPSQQLTALDLSGNQFGDTGAEVLRLAPLPNLHTLRLRADDLPFADCIHADGATRLAESPTLTQLRELDLRGHHIGDAGLIELVSSANATHLQVLDVGFNDIGETGDSAIEALIRSPHLGELRVLRLNGSTLDRLMADALARWDRLEQMGSVDLRRCEFGTGARERLGQSPWAAKFVFE